MAMELKKQIKDHISNLNSAEDIFTLFKLLGYPEENIFDTSYKRDKKDFNFKKEDYDRIENVYSVLNFEKKLPAFLLETKSLAPSFIRSVTKKFDSQYMWFLLIFTTSNDYSEVLFVLPDREKVEAGKYKLKLTKLTVNKEEIRDKNEYFTVIDTLSKIRYEKEANWRFVWKKWRDAFNVEKVTESFFDDYKKVFFELRKKIKEQGIPQKDSHEFTLQFLNRIMFTYFISKKGWLQYPKFMNWFWTEYKKLNKYGSNEFYDHWLNQVFFKAFNNRSYEITNLPTEIKETVSSFPYLNGGLFVENDYDLEGIEISDAIFQRIFEFFEKYNFTIKENMPLESEVAVNPQMIGYVYESLANVADEIYDRNDMGIFYTPNVEVDFMCKRSLVEYFSKNLPEIPKEKIYHFVFDLPEDKWKIEEYLSNEELWHEFEDACDNLSVVDPACGSGAFLVGMLNVLDELYKIIYKHTERDLTDFERKYRIIQYSLYGVDVMPWAIHAAELRLWLQLIIETELKGEELRKSPLLPNLNLKLRIGDSLIQEIGGVTFNVRSNNLDSSIKKDLDNLKREKRLYYESSRTAKFKNPKEFKKEEIRLFKKIIDKRLGKIQEKIEFLQKGLKLKQSTLGIETSKKIESSNKKEERIKNEIKKHEENVKKLQKIKKVLKDPEKKPFIWDIDFAEIFGDKNGFDIVIGNPPYLRQQKISPPNKIKSDVTLEDKQEYKEKLVNSVQNEFSMIDKIDGKGDYYIYFYFHGLRLLNENGTFCFITSNSWLDLDYGKSLQEFLLKYVPIIGIYDNPKRSFKHADVNTIIAVLACPQFKDKKIGEHMKKSENVKWNMLNHEAKFVMFKNPFEIVTNALDLIEIENIKVKIKGSPKITELVENVVEKTNYRVFPVVQKDLLESGWNYPKNCDKEKNKFKTGTYKTGHWGIKYLKAPKSFYNIISKGLGKLNELKELADIETYLNTGGADDFFFLKGKVTNKGFKIENTEKDFYLEKEFIKKLINSPKTIKNTKITPNVLKEYLLAIPCEIKTSQLKKSNTWEYIKWGEEKGYNKKSGRKNKKKWWCLPLQAYKGSSIIIPCRINKKHAIYWNPSKLVSHRYYRLKPKENVNETLLLLSLNSTITFLSMELFRNPNLGGGVLDLTKPLIEKIVVMNPKFLKSFEKDEFLNREPLPIFEEIGINPLKTIHEQEPNPLPDRAKLDNIIFDELGLTEKERKEVYWSLCELVKQRLDKANSLNGGQ